MLDFERSGGVPAEWRSARSGVSMHVRITCPTCGTSGVLPDARPGEAVACPHCKTVFTAGGSAQTPGTPDVLGIWLGPAETATDLTLPATPAPATPAPATPAPATPARPPAPPPVQPPAPPTVPAGVSPLPDWARGEMQRVNQYVAHELDKLKQARHLLVEMKSKA